MTTQKDDTQARADETRDAQGEQAGATASGARLPYRAPQLRHLGSVRELTLGGTPQAAEGAGTKGPPKGGGGGGGKGM